MVNRIKELRTSISLTQSELGKVIGVNQSAIGKYERGELEPNIETIQKLADFFECSTDYLLGRSDDLGVISISSQKQNAAELTPEGSELLDLFNGLEKEYRAQVLEYVRFIAERRNAVKRKKY